MSAAYVPFDESRFPCDAQEYRQRVAAGRQLMSGMDVAICLLARDCARRLANTIGHVEATATLFREATIVIVENDSRDATPRVLSKWSADSRFDVIVHSETRDARKWGMVRSGHRGTDMASYRNLCRSIALEAMPDVGSVIVADADLAGWSLDGLAESFGRWDTWDVAASNGLRRDGGRYVQADAWAFRKRDWRAIPFSHVKHIVPARGEEPMLVRSAFGGLAVYTADAYRAAEYAGGDCEHVTFHRMLADAGHGRLILNPSQISIYRW